MRLTSKNLILNSLILEYCQFWEIHILILLVEELPDRIVTYNLDFRGFWLSKGETTIFQNFFLSLTSLKQKCHVEGTEIHHIDTPLAKRTLKKFAEINELETEKNPDLNS